MTTLVDVDEGFRFYVLPRAGRGSGTFMNEADIARFRAFPITIEGPGCWLWEGAVKDTGYAAFRVGGRSGKTVRAHRFMWEMLHGEIPDGAEICHRCDVRHCINPDHLYIGTKSVNMCDMWRRGRANRGPRRGEMNGMSKVSDIQRQDIALRRNAGESLKVLAAEFGLSTTTVWKIGRVHAERSISSGGVAGGPSSTGSGRPVRQRP